MSPDNLEFVILAAGKSTRNYPHSKGIPHKSLVPFGSKKVIDFIVEQIIKAGGKHITIVVSDEGAIEAFEQCFCREPDIEKKFIAKGNDVALALLRNLYIPEDVQIKYIIQSDPKGVGHAIGLSYREIQKTNRSIVMIWPDDIVVADKFADDENARTSIYKRAVDEYIKMGCQGNLGITRTVSDPTRWGIIDAGYFIEKPKNPTSDQAAFALFIFDKKVCERLMDASIKLDKGIAVEGIVGGELVFDAQLNSVIKEDPDKMKIKIIPMLETDTYLDCGNIEGYEKALIFTLLTESKFKEGNFSFVKSVLNKVEDFIEKEKKGEENI